MNLIIKNPHSVLAALESRPKDVLSISLTSSAGEGWDRVEALAKKLGTPLKFGGNSGKNGPRHANDGGGGRSGAEAQIREKEPVAIEELFSEARDREDGKGLWLALDQIQDPHNLGAIFRSAAFFGVQGIVLMQDRAAPMNAAAYDVSSGGIETVPFATVANLQRAFEAAKEEGLWILGTSEHARDDLRSIQRDRPWLLVVGNEEKGLRRLTQDSCDLLCAIKPRGGVTSLNVSVAAGVCIAHLSGAVGTP